MVNVLESVIGGGFISMFGDPNIAGLAIVGFFAAAVMLWPTHPALKMLAIFCGFILAAPFMPVISIILAFGGGLILWQTVERIFIR